MFKEGIVGKLQLYQQLETTFENRKKTILREGDKMFFDKKHRLAGFWRKSSCLVGAVGADDKFLIEWDDLVSIMNHFGIALEFEEKRHDLMIYNLRQSKSLAQE